MSTPRRRSNFGQWALAFAASLTIGLSATVLWYVLDSTARAKIAERAESESYATRSALARSLLLQMQSLRDVANFWDSFAAMPPGLWDRDARIELNHFQGTVVILWTDQQGSIRYATTPDNFALDRRPDDAQWASYQPVLEGGGDERTPAIIGPTATDSGWTYRVRYPGRSKQSSGMLVALVNIDELLSTLLIDRSPGYAINVSWGEQEIFSRDTAAASIPEEWTRDGWIELPTGPMWQVVHAPTSQLLESLHEPAIPGVLIAGWLIAFLTAALIIQNGRVKRRAVEAETAERQVSRLNENLERQVESRTRELANRTSDLETISESVAHDLRNPLNTIGMNAALLQQEFGDGATPEIFESMAHATQRMVRILERLEGFSHATFTPFERQPIDMNALVDDVCEELAVAEANRSIRFQRQDLPNCTADRGMIRILLLNLISNSCKYTHSTPDPLVEIGADVDGGRVVYFVRDNGIGFAENRSDEMFKPFTRFDNGVAEGRGMGLAIAARIVQRHGGRIWAKSIPGAGATFYFELEAA